jgi:ABC-type polysaccharide/polyol phosphate export permease
MMLRMAKPRRVASLAAGVPADPLAGESAPPRADVRAAPLEARRLLDVLRLLVRRDLRLRYRNSALGVVWAVLLPLAQALVLVFVFQVIVPLEIEAYPAFVLAALLPWTWFGSSVMSATTSFIDNRDLVRHPGFRPPLLVAVAVISNFFLYLVALPILMAVMLAYERPPTAALWAFVPLAAAQAALSIGAGLVAATLNVFFRDVAYVVGVALMLLFYLTPVFYRGPESVFAYRVIATVNPLAALMEGYRAVFFEGSAPPLDALLASAVGGAVVLVAGLLVWRRCEQSVLDTL